MVDPRPGVTVGMPVYNDPPGLRRSVPTVFSQTWPGDIRLLIVDDGSDRETVETIASLADAYGRIDVVRNPTNRGRPHARNQILEHAGEGELAWLDAGDLWHPRKLELQRSALDAAPDGGPVICVSPLQRYFIDQGRASVMVPDVSGDQLYNALTGRLFGYLPTMLGAVEAFRDLGFDERLLRRQDYDFLVRFLAAGGRVVSTPEDQPLFTYLKSDTGGSADTVAKANRVIREKHAPYYARYGSGLAREVRRNQHNLVARFHEANGETRQAAAERWRARLADPVQQVALLPRLARRALPAEPARAPVRLVLRAARLALALLERLRVVTPARLASLANVTERLGIRRALGLSDRQPTEGGDEVHELARDLMARGDHTSTAERLESAVAAQQPADPETWLLLEAAYRRDGRLHSAKRALERGLEQHPEDVDLTVRLIELLSLRREWEDCVEQWSQLGSDTAEHHTPLLHRRVARALRSLDDPQGAVEVARAGLQRWPDDAKLEQELRISRALTVDWASAIGPPSPAAEAPTDAAGVVTDLGFLATGAGPVEGEVELGRRHAPRVALLVDGREVAATFASPSRGTEGRGWFSLNCRDILDYLGDGDVITLRCEDRPVALPGGSDRLLVAPGFPSRRDELFRRLDNGHVFMKFGHLALGNTLKRKRSILALYAEVGALLERERGHTLHPFYGNLLGAIRDHDFIGHDVGGFDVGYLSPAGEPEQVRREQADVARLFAAHGYQVELHPWSLHVRLSREDKVFVDINYAWFDAEGLGLSYGWRFERVTDRDRFVAPRESAIHGLLCPVPGNAEDVLVQVYGRDWAIPIQGFDPDAGITRDERYLLTREEMERLEDENPDRIKVRSVLAADGEVVYVG